MTAKQLWGAGRGIGKFLVHAPGFLMFDSATGEGKDAKSPGWGAKALQELSYRIQLLFHAPSQECTQRLEKERVYLNKQFLAEEYSKGYLAGWRECYAACLEAVEAELAKGDNLWAAGELLSDSAKLLKTN